MALELSEIEFTTGVDCKWDGVDLMPFRTGTAQNLMYGKDMVHLFERGQVNRYVAGQTTQAKVYDPAIRSRQFYDAADGIGVGTWFDGEFLDDTSKQPLPAFSPTLGTAFRKSKIMECYSRCAAAKYMRVQTENEIAFSSSNVTRRYGSAAVSADRPYYFARRTGSYGSLSPQWHIPFKGGQTLVSRDLGKFVDKCNGYALAEISIYRKTDNSGTVSRTATEKLQIRLDGGLVKFFPRGYRYDGNGLWLDEMMQNACTAAGVWADMNGFRTWKDGSTNGEMEVRARIASRVGLTTSMALKSAYLFNQ